MTSKVHAACDGRGRSVLLRLSAGQTSNYNGAAMMVDALSTASTMLADRAYDARWSRKALADCGVTPCIPPHAQRKIQRSYDRALYQQPRRIENMLARLKDWRRIHTRYDRCAHTFLSPSTRAATYLFCFDNF